MGGARRAKQAVAGTVVAVVLASCATGTASISDADGITPPTFSPPPPSPAASPQLDAIVLRDTDGLLPTGTPPDPDILEGALELVAAEMPEIELLADLYFDDTNVWMTALDPASPNRTFGVYWSEWNGLHTSEPRFVEDETTFPIDIVDVDAIRDLVEGLEARFPTLVVDMPRLHPDLSYRLGLSWRLELIDARGTLATVWADLDGTVIAVDPE